MYQSILFNYDIIKTSCSQFQNILSKNLHNFASRTPVNQKLITVLKQLFFLLIWATEGGTMTLVLVNFRGPIREPTRFKGAMGLKGLMRGPTGLHRAHRNGKDRRPFFLFGDHLKTRRKLCHFAAKTFFLSLFFGNQLKSGENCAIFLASFGLHKTRDVYYFSCPRAHPWLSVPLLMTSLPAMVTN